MTRLRQSVQKGTRGSERIVTYHGLEADEDPALFNVVSLLFGVFAKCGKQLAAVGWRR